MRKIERVAEIIDKPCHIIGAEDARSASSEVHGIERHTAIYLTFGKHRIDI
jgi:hypothetical protein